MTQRLSLPDRGFTNPQRLLPEGGGVEDVRRALNRVYDQLDRVADDSGLIRQTVAPQYSPLRPGGGAVTAGPNNGTGIEGGGTATGGGTGGGTGTGGGGTTGGGGIERPPVTLYMPANESGVLTIDHSGYVALQSITV